MVIAVKHYGETYQSFFRSFHFPLISLFVPLFFSGIAREKLVPQWCSVKTVFLENSQNSQENTCARVSFLMKLQANTTRRLLPSTVFQRNEKLITNFP